MNTALQLGPVTLPYALLLTLAALIVGSGLAERTARRQGLAPPPTLTLLLVTAVASRLAFAASYPGFYWQDPWSLLDIRDGGWSPPAAIAALLAASAWVAWRRPPLRRALVTGVLPGLALWIGGNALLARLPQAAAQTLPSWNLPLLDGQVLALDDLRGQPVVLNLWASWCPPCRREMPVLEQAQRDYPGVHFVLLNQGESGAVVTDYLARSQLTPHGIALDPAGLAGRHFGLPLLPSTLFFDADGRLADVRLGEVSRASLAQRLERLGVAVPTAAP